MKSKALLLTGLVALSGCDTEVVFSNGKVTTVAEQLDPPGMNSGQGGGNTDIPADPGTTVCDPFGGRGEATARNGLSARLKFLLNEQPRYESATDYVTYGKDAGVNLYFSKVDVPTRPFDRGFVTQAGETLKNIDGTTLYEYFGIRFESRIRLTENDAEGRYQFAVLSDDGSIFRVLEPGSESLATLINNDGVTPSRLRCATRTISMDSSTRLPIQLDYYQGPRFHISLILLWRKIDGTNLGDLACEKAGNGIFFDSTQDPPAPQTEWIGLLDRGWKVLEPGNYVLPGEQEENPCQGGGLGT